jgi:hypothetical protein
MGNDPILSLSQSNVQTTTLLTPHMVDRRRIELLPEACKATVLPLSLTAHYVVWSRIRVSIPSGHLERVMTSPEV